jgi:DNA-binding transcriptional MerR regulator
MIEQIKDSENLSDLVAKIEGVGIPLESVKLSVKDVVRLSGVTDRTVRRYIAKGVLTPDTLQGPKGKEYELSLSQVLDVFTKREDTIKRGKVSPMNDLAGSIESLRQALESERAAGAAAQKELLDRLDAQSKLIDDLRHEQRDARAQVHQLQEQIIKALPAPAKAPWYLRLIGRG